MMISLGYNPSLLAVDLAREDLQKAGPGGHTVSYQLWAPGAGPKPVTLAITNPHVHAAPPAAQHVYADCLGGESSRYSEHEIGAAVNWLVKNGRANDAKRLAEITDPCGIGALALLSFGSADES